MDPQKIVEELNFVTRIIDVLRVVTNRGGHRTGAVRLRSKNLNPWHNRGW